MPIRYHLTLSDPERARGADPALAFRSQGAEGLAAELQQALRTDALFERWRAQQEEPDDVDPALGATDPAATVRGEQHDLHVELVAVTALPGSILRHRLRLLAGDGWSLRDVSAA
ncbi:MAG TPA: hypothetical protein VM576_03845 [Xanthomonadaceae bacterium]|jgi:hypothetical protein|nr:hypothetical protein [Xanthomonadaceae bacterium]